MTSLNLHAISSPANTSIPPGESALGAILQLELRVAQQADELARTHGYAHAREFWMQAEAEVLSRQFLLAAVA
jgi:hypothetical protein